MIVAQTNAQGVWCNAAAAIFRAVTAAAENQNHGIWLLQCREPSAFSGNVREFVVGKVSPATMSLRIVLQGSYSVKAQQSRG